MSPGQPACAVTAEPLRRVHGGDCPCPPTKHGQKETLPPPTTSGTLQGCPISRVGPRHWCSTEVNDGGSNRPDGKGDDGMGSRARARY